jgi:hypothetical protein
MYSFITKTKNGYVLAIRSDYDYSSGHAISTAIYASKIDAKKAAKLAGAKAWNY